MMKKLIYIILGIIIGLLSKYSDIAYCNSLYYYLGLISSGLVIWLFIYIIIITKSTNKTDCLINIILFIIPMLTSYYLFSYYFIHYLYKKIIYFWIIIFLLSLFIINIIFNKINNKLFNIIYILLSIILIIIDSLYINGINIIIITIELIITILGWRNLHEYRK